MILYEGNSITLNCNGRLEICCISDRTDSNNKLFNSSCVMWNFFWLIVCFMRTKTLCLKVHLNYFKRSIPKWYAHTFTVDTHISVMVTFWEPPYRSRNTIQDFGVARHAIHSVQEDGTWSNTKAVRCSKEPHTYTLINIKQVTLMVEQLSMYMRYLVGLVKKRYIIYVPTVLSRNWRVFCKKFRLRWSAVSVNLE